MNVIAGLDDAERRQFAVGVGFAAVALVVTPVLHALAPLSFLLGLVVAVVAPAVFGVAALAVAVRLYRTQERGAGVLVAVAGFLGTLVGVGYGAMAVL